MTERTDYSQPSQPAIYAFLLAMVVAIPFASTAVADSLVLFPRSFAPHHGLPPESPLKAEEENLLRSRLAEAETATANLRTVAKEHLDAAARAGDLDLAEFWQATEKTIDSLTKANQPREPLVWDYGKEGEEKWEARFQSRPFPHNFTTALTDCISAYLKAWDELEQGYDRLLDEAMAHGSIKDTIFILDHRARMGWTRAVFVGRVLLNRIENAHTNAEISDAGECLCSELEGIPSWMGRTPTKENHPLGDICERFLRKCKNKTLAKRVERARDSATSKIPIRQPRETDADIVVQIPRLKRPANVDQKVGGAWDAYAAAIEASVALFEEASDQQCKKSMENREPWLVQYWAKAKKIQNYAQEKPMPYDAVRFPKDASTAVRARDAFATAFADLQEAYDRAVREYTQEKQLEGARAVRDERDSLFRPKASPRE